MYPATAHRAGGPVPATTTHSHTLSMPADLLPAYGGVDALTGETREELRDHAVCLLAGPHSGPVTHTVGTDAEGSTTVTAEAVCTDPRCRAHAHASAFLQDMRDALRTADGYLERIAAAVDSADDPAATWSREAVTTGTVLRVLIEAVEPHAGPRPLDPSIGTM